MKTFRNLTPHNITLKDGTQIPSEGAVRLSETRTVKESFVIVQNRGHNEYITEEWQLDDCNPDFIKPFPPIVEKEWGGTDLPEEQDGTYLIVSALVANAFPERKDLVCPETARNESGVYCSAFVRAKKAKPKNDGEVSRREAARKEGEQYGRSSGAAELAKEVLRLLQNGEVKPVVDVLMNAVDKYERAYCE